MIRILAAVLLGILVLVPAGLAASDPGFNESVPGDRNVGQYFSWSINNVSNRADVVYHYTVYASRIIGDEYTFYSPAWGQWFTREAGPGYHYLAVWIRAWTEGTTVWGYGPDRFKVLAWDNMTISNETTHLEDLPVRYGSEKYRPVVIAELENRIEADGFRLPAEWYGWKDGEELTRMESGESNAWFGWILYRVPESARLEDLRVWAPWYYYGAPIWYLSHHEIKQNSFESWQADQVRILNEERETGLRVSDRDAASRGRF